MVDICIVNASDVLTDAQAAAVIPGLQKWDDDYLRPAWGLPRCIYHFLPRGQLPNPNDKSVWPIFLNRHSKDEGVLGWHTYEAGLTYGRVFVGDCLRYGISWTVDLSHEAGEARVDPRVNQIFTLANGDICLKEVGDAVESDDNAIWIDGVAFTDFTMPDYFSSKRAGRFDWQNKLHGPVPALTLGGYMAIFKKSSGIWTQISSRALGGPPSFRSVRFDRSHRYARLPDFSQIAA